VAPDAPKRAAFKKYARTDPISIVNRIFLNIRYQWCHFFSSPFVSVLDQSSNLGSIISVDEEVVKILSIKIEKNFTKKGRCRFFSETRISLFLFGVRAVFLLKYMVILSYIFCSA
jgi:hypothetical protein